MVDLLTYEMGRGGAVTAAAARSSSSSCSSRRIRAFKRWMTCQGVDCSDALHLLLLLPLPRTQQQQPKPKPKPKPKQQEEEEKEEEMNYYVSVESLCDLKEGDLLATIPKHSCLTIRTTGCSRHIIQSPQITPLGLLSLAIMYEKSLGPLSPWYPYLQLLPQSGEPIPLLWTQHQIHSLLSGTELHKIVEEDKDLFLKEWQEYILPLVASASPELHSDFFSVDQYFVARSLVSSRSFHIDEFHGFGMVPLADLFNHKTGAENVHITSASSHATHESYIEDINMCEEFRSPGNDGELFAQSSPSRKGHSEDTLEASTPGASSSSEDDPSVLEIIIVKAVESGSEIFNTYGSLGNAALLHRYGFTELDNPYDIVNIDLELVLEWSSSLFSARHSRARLSLLQRLDYSGCTSNCGEYFEISFDGEPQIELLILLYILLLPEEAFFKLDLTMSTAAGAWNGSVSAFALLETIESKFVVIKSSEMSDKDSRNLLLTEAVRDALFSLANIREGLYGSTSIEDDIRALDRCCTRDRKMYYSLILRVSERRILQKLREYATPSTQLTRKAKKR